jgi:peptide/nickel transport system permease protein
MRFSDMMFAIPSILFALAIVTALGASVWDSSIAIGVGWIPIFVRVVRGPVLALRESDFVRAGKVLGFSRTRLLFRHILPSVAGVIAVQVSLALSWAILAEAGLSFLGLGPPPPVQSLGEMVSNSSSLASIAWWTLAGPSLVIVIAVIGFNFLGDGLRDAADPRTKTR